MLDDVIADYVEVVGEGGGDDLGPVEVVTLTDLELLDMFNERVGYYQEDGSRIGITLKYTLLELKGVSFPVFGDRSSLQFRINVLL